MAAAVFFQVLGHISAGTKVIDLVKLVSKSGTGDWGKLGEDILAKVSNIDKKLELLTQNAEDIKLHQASSAYREVTKKIYLATKKLESNVTDKNKHKHSDSLVKLCKDILLLGNDDYRTLLDSLTIEFTGKMEINDLIKEPETLLKCYSRQLIETPQGIELQRLSDE